MQGPAVSGSQMLIGLAIGVAALVGLILKTKIHAFPARIIAATVTGLVGGMDPWSIRTTLAWLTSGITLVIINALFG